MNPMQALGAAIALSLWALAVIVGFFALGIVFALGWPYWAFAWMLALLLLLLPQTVYSSFVKAEYRNERRRGAMRKVNADGK